MDENKEDNDNNDKDNNDNNEMEKHGDNEEDDDEEDKDEDVDKMSNKRKQQYLKKVDIKQGKKLPKMDVQTQSNTKQSWKGGHCQHGLKNCSMNISYRNKLMEGIDVMADAAQQEIVDVHDSNKEKEYIELDTIGQS